MTISRFFFLSLTKPEGKTFNVKKLYWFDKFQNFFGIFNMTIKYSNCLPDSSETREKAFSLVSDEGGRRSVRRCLLIVAIWSTKCSFVYPPPPPRLSLSLSLSLSLFPSVCVHFLLLFAGQVWLRHSPQNSEGWPVPIKNDKLIRRPSKKPRPKAKCP